MAATKSANTAWKVKPQRADKPVTLPAPLEHEEQKAVIQWCDRFGWMDPRLTWIFAVPNGARTALSVAKRLRAEGLKKGVPDLFLPVPIGHTENGVWHGLFIEMKRTKGGTTSAEQKAWGAFLSKQGYRYIKAKGAVSAIQAIVEYLGLPPSIVPGADPNEPIKAQWGG